MASSVRLAPLQGDLLNLVRAMGAQLVLVGHATHYYLRPVNPYGHYETFGVLIFFILSGFLICSSVLQKWGRPDYRFEHYLTDRTCRIFVAYAPALIFVATADTLMRQQHAFAYEADETLGTWLGNLAMLQGYPVFQVLRRLGVPEQSWFIEPFGSGRPFWTVAIEWWIYLFFGYFAFFALRGRGLTMGRLTILILLAVVPVYNAMGGVGDCLTLVWMVGGLFAPLQNWLVTKRGPAGRRIDQEPEFLPFCVLGIGVCALLLAGRVVRTGFEVYDLQFASFVAAVLFGLFFLVGSVNVALPPRLSRAIEALAAYSYSLYLVHFTVLMMFALYFPSLSHRDFLKFFTILIVANLVGIVFWFVFERHHKAIADAVKRALDRRRLSAGMQIGLVEPMVSDLTRIIAPKEVDKT